MNRYFAGLTIAALTSTVSVFAGTIIVNNDEWTLSNSGFASEGSANGTAFAQNAAQYLTGSASGAKVWIDSDNFGLNGSNLQTALSGYALTDTGTFSAFTLATLQGYQAVFLGGDALTAGEESALISYVNGGGSVYIAAGTGSIGSSSAVRPLKPLNGMPFSIASGSLWQPATTASAEIYPPRARAPFSTA
jgi:hypothetical protein